MTVSQLAKMLSIPADTVRYYVRTGLLTPKKDPQNGYKYFDSQQQKKLQFILQAKSLGFSLADIETIMAQSQSGQSPCPQVREMMAARLTEIEQKITEMQRTYELMKQAVKTWQDQPDCNPTGEHICHLIEGFTQGGCCND